MIQRLFRTLLIISVSAGGRIVAVTQFGALGYRWNIRVLPFYQVAEHENTIPSEQCDPFRRIQITEAPAGTWNRKKQTARNFFFADLRL